MLKRLPPIGHQGSLLDFGASRKSARDPSAGAKNNNTNSHIFAQCRNHLLSVAEVPVCSATRLAGNNIVQQLGSVESNRCSAAVLLKTNGPALVFKNRARLGARRFCVKTKCTQCGRLHEKRPGVTQPAQQRIQTKHEK